MSVGKRIVHLNPVWRDRADCLIQAPIATENLSDEWEQLWAQEIESRRFVICCIPFFLYDIALGDEVVADDYVFDRVVKPSGRFVFRVWYGDSEDPFVERTVADCLLDLGCVSERYSKNLLAVDANSPEQAKKVADNLQGLEDQKLLRCDRSRFLRFFLPISLALGAG